MSADAAAEEDSVGAAQNGQVLARGTSAPG